MIAGYTYKLKSCTVCDEKSNKVFTIQLDGITVHVKACSQECAEKRFKYELED